MPINPGQLIFLIQCNLFVFHLRLCYRFVFKGLLGSGSLKCYFQTSFFNFTQNPTMKKLLFSAKCPITMVNEQTKWKKRGLTPCGWWCDWINRLLVIASIVAAHWRHTESKRKPVRIARVGPFPCVLCGKAGSVMKRAETPNRVRACSF